MEFELRPWKKSDAESLQKHANSSAVAAFLTDQFPHPFSLRQAKSFIKGVSGYNPPRIFAIDVGGDAVGSIGITLQGDVHRMNAEIGYWLSEIYWGRGIATEAVKRMSAYAFEKFEINRLFARCFSSNLALHRVLEKAGFLLKAKYFNTLIKNNVIYDGIIYALRKENFFYHSEISL